MKNKTKIDLNKCKKGDKLRIRLEGEIGESMKKRMTDIVTYLKKDSASYLAFPHIIQYSDGTEGSRTDDGKVYVNRCRPDDMDVLEVL